MVTVSKIGVRLRIAKGMRRTCVIITDGPITPPPAFRFRFDGQCSIRHHGEKRASQGEPTSPAASQGLHDHRLGTLEALEAGDEGGPGDLLNAQSKHAEADFLGFGL
jgi:hypothetical protein